MFVQLEVRFWLWERDTSEGLVCQIFTTGFVLITREWIQFLTWVQKILVTKVLYKSKTKENKAPQCHLHY
mgnify:CR=1 FL=1